MRLRTNKQTHKFNSDTVGEWPKLRTEVAFPCKMVGSTVPTLKSAREPKNTEGGRKGGGGGRSAGASRPLQQAAVRACFCSKTCLSASAPLQVLLMAWGVLLAASKTFPWPSPFVSVSPYEVSMSRRSRGRRQTVQHWPLTMSQAGWHQPSSAAGQLLDVL